MKIALAVAATVALWGWAEWQNWHWSRQLTQPPRSGRRTIVVLGYRNRAPTPNVVNRWRAEIALRALSARRDDLLVISGGDTSGDGATEARKVATYIRADPAQMFVERLDVLLGMLPRLRWRSSTSLTATWLCKARSMCLAAVLRRYLSPGQLRDGFNVNVALEPLGRLLQGQLGGHAPRCLARKRHCALVTRSKISVPG